MPRMTIEELRKRFVYTRDTKGDDWQIMDQPLGKLRGDCEDFALTALWVAAGCSRLRMWWWITRGKACLWWCNTSQADHMILYVKDLGWIDNRQPYWSEEPSTKPTIPWVLPLFAMSMLLK